jgi:hypothetical protein
MAPKGPLGTFQKCLLDANWTLFRDRRGGRAVGLQCLERPVGNSSLPDDLIDALFHSKVSEQSWKPERG